MMQRNIEATVRIVAMVLWGANSDRTGERLWHTIRFRRCVSQD
jgi:hypothetical protein